LAKKDTVVRDVDFLRSVYVTRGIDIGSDSMFCGVSFEIELDHHFFIEFSSFCFAMSLNVRLFEQNGT
jgi:hypothetical protein